MWGGLAASLVALPASIAFGVAVFAPLGVGAGAGALAGLLGAVALGTLAPILGGTPRLVSAPCAPAVAVMGAFALNAIAREPGEPARVMVLMTLVGLVAAAIQLGLGLLRAGSIIKYIPLPVVTGYLSGVAIVIVLKQLPAVLGLAAGTPLWAGVTHPGAWRWPSLVVALATMTAMGLGPRLTKAVPAAILGLFAGVVAFGALSFFLPDMRTLQGNPYVIGPLGGGAGSFVDAFRARIVSLTSLRLGDALAVIGPAATLSVVLSLDTLKTCVVVDAMTGARHESNRELIAQGIANATSAFIGGMPGAGTSGATLVNVASGAETRWSAVIEGVAVLVSYLALAGIVAWAPLAALAGILVMVAWKMVDWSALRWGQHRSTVFDLAVVLTVMAVAVFVDLISASAVGVSLSILLFIRSESRSSVIRGKHYGDKLFSKRRRLADEAAALARHGGETVVVELQGSLFFGTTDQLRTRLEADLRERRTVVLDMRRVDALDLTAAHILAQMQEQLRKRGASAVFCNLPRSLSGHSDARTYLRQLGLLRPDEEADTLFDTVSDALARAEDRILAERCPANDNERDLELLEMAMFSGRKPETVAALRSCVEERTVPADGVVFAHGDGGDEIFFIRRGTVRISLPIDGKHLHVASFGRGDFIGEIAFLDHGARSADAIAESEVSLYVVSRAAFDRVAQAHPRLGQAVFASLASALALRLRTADSEIGALEEG